MKWDKELENLWFFKFLFQDAPYHLFTSNTLNL